MKTAVLGGGFTGLTAAYYLGKKKTDVTVFEKESILGGLASGFRPPGWDWSLERAYHHIFHNDTDILDFAKEIEFNDIFFQEPETASLYSRIIPVDTPQDFMKFPLLSFPDKIRSAAILAFLKLSPHFSIFDRETAESFLKKTMGNEVWGVLWKELFRKKFGKYAGNIVAAFIWARIHKRTKSLGYVRGGFQAFIDRIAAVDTRLGAQIKRGESANIITKANNGFLVNGEPFDRIISTLPTPVLTRLTDGLFPDTYTKRLGKLKYLHAVNLIIETDRPILFKTYWLNICVKELPFVVVVQHTNFIDKKFYGGKHIAYIAKYVETKDALMKMNKDEVINQWLPPLKNTLHPKFKILNSYLFKGLFAQPIFDKEFVKNKPDLETPVKNFHIANLDMTYPYDRGTNYAVWLGKEVSRLP